MINSSLLISDESWITLSDSLERVTTSRGVVQWPLNDDSSSVSVLRNVYVAIHRLKYYMRVRSYYLSFYSFYIKQVQSSTY